MERKKITTENVQHNEYVIRMRNMQKGRAGGEKNVGTLWNRYSTCSRVFWFIQINNLNTIGILITN